MFSNKNTISPRKHFQLSVQQIEEDIEAICNDEEQRNKLYYCLDKSPPKEDKFLKVEEFLKGSDELENVVKNIEIAGRQLKESNNKLREQIDEIRQKAASYK